MEYKKIGELTTVITGGTPATNIAEYWDTGDIPWLQSGCCQNCDVDRAEKYITQTGYENSNTKMMPPDTVMIALTGATAGKIGYLKFDACGNQSITGILPCDVLDQRYLFYYLLSKRAQILSDCIGGAQPHISQGYVKDILIPVLPIKEQKEIAQKVIYIDSLISLRKQQLAKLDEAVKARFVEMFGDIALNPFGWEKDNLGAVCDVRDGTHDSPKYYETGYPLVTSKNVTGGKVDLTDCSLICEGDFNKINERSKVDIGDIIMPMIGTVGKPVIVDIEPNFAIKNVSLIKLKANSRVLNIYIRALLQSDYFDEAVLSKVRGGTQKFISLGDIRNLAVLIPPLNLQQQFATFVEQTDKSKLAIQKSLDKLEVLKKSLMQQYFG